MTTNRIGRKKRDKYQKNSGICVRDKNKEFNNDLVGQKRVLGRRSREKGPYNMCLKPILGPLL